MAARRCRLLLADGIVRVSKPTAQRLLPARAIARPLSQERDYAATSAVRARVARQAAPRSASLQANARGRQPVRRRSDSARLARAPNIWRRLFRDRDLLLASKCAAWARAF